MIAKPRTNKVMVKNPYIYASKEEKKIWYTAEVKERLIIQFTAEYIKDGEIIQGYYFYKDIGFTWKEIM